MYRISLKLLSRVFIWCVFGFLTGFFISYSVEHYLEYHALETQVCDYEDI